MARELTPSYEKDYLELLYDYHSEEAKKTRRNLIAASFIVVAVHLLGLTLADVKIAGVGLANGNPRVMIVLAIALIGYWSIMFLIYEISDRTIHNERRHLLTKNVLAVKEDLDKMKAEKEAYEKGGQRMAGVARQNLLILERNYEIIKSQLDRTKSARMLRLVTTSIEYALPILFAAWAIGYLWIDLSKALS